MMGHAKLPDTVNNGKEICRNGCESELVRGEQVYGKVFTRHMQLLRKWGDDGKRPI